MSRQTAINHGTGRLETKTVAKARERAMGTPVDTSTVAKRIKRALVG